MNYRVLFFLIALTIMLMGSILFFAVSNAAKETQNVIFKEQKNQTLFHPSVQKATFSLGIPAFTTLDQTCSPPFATDAYINVHMQYQLAPESCEIFVNDRLVSVERRLQPDCIGECPYEQFARTFHLGKLDTREGHSVKVCCEGICILEQLAAPCAE